MAPLLKECQKHPDKFDVKVCITAQHRQMLDQVLDFFGIIPDYDLDIMKSNQTLFDITTSVLNGLNRVLDQVMPDMIFVQGDTTTTFIGALAGFYKKISVAHLEAGLRSDDKCSPFPEEINRILTGHLSTYHFPPTQNAKNNLLKEGIKKNIFLVGNTVVDALFLGLDIIKQQGDGKYLIYFNLIDFSKKIILVTGHRRESFGEGFDNICHALKVLADKYYDDVEIVYPVHLNPNVREPVTRILNKTKNVHLIEPLEYPHLLWLMNKSYFILTDSGGIQEEAPSLGKPVLVMRNVTERTEGIEAGTAKLVGTKKEDIIKQATLLITSKKEYSKMAKCSNPYGDGKSSKKIIDMLLALC